MTLLMNPRIPRISLTRKLPNPNLYALQLIQENLDLNYDEERAPLFRGKWREEAFSVKKEVPLDLEIGTGNGFHFAHFVENHPNRYIVGLELKYKPLIQSLKRAKKTGLQNFRMVRYTAKYLEDLFEPKEIDNVYIHFPDPWAYKTHQIKNRLLTTDFFQGLFELQRRGSFVEFKTDHEEYFLSVKDSIKNTGYIIERYTEDLHQSIWDKENFQTHFEKLWASKGLKAHMLRLKKS